jgi:hypothetical protein
MRIWVNKHSSLFVNNRLARLKLALSAKNASNSVGALPGGQESRADRILTAGLDKGSRRNVTFLNSDLRRASSGVTDGEYAPSAGDVRACGLSRLNSYPITNATATLSKCVVLDRYNPEPEFKWTTFQDMYASGCATFVLTM